VELEDARAADQRYLLLRADRDGLRGADEVIALDHQPVVRAFARRAHHDVSAPGDVKRVVLVDRGAEAAADLLGVLPAGGLGDVAVAARRAVAVDALSQLPPDIDGLVAADDLTGVSRHGLAAVLPDGLVAILPHALDEIA